MTEPIRPTGRRGVASGVVGGLSKDQRLAELEARLQRLERAPSLRARGRSVMDKVMPPEASEHFRNAGREQLLGVRSIVDFWIQRIDQAESQAAGRSRERETIEIE
jgi:hypothetical protein